VRNSNDRGRIVRRSGTLLLALAAAGLVMSACGGTKAPKAATSSTTTTAASHSSTTTKPTATSTTVAPTPTTTVPFAISQVHTGTGPATLADFTVPANTTEWDIDWVYDCSKTGGTGAFGISVVGHGSAANTTDAGVTQSGKGLSGIAKNYDTGTFNLKVASACKWTVRVEVIS
jgi:hypothetical protein